MVSALPPLAPQTQEPPAQHSPAQEPPASPPQDRQSATLEEQLQQLQRRVQALVPQVEQLTCERVNAEQQRLTPIYGTAPVERGGSSVVLPVHQNGALACVVGFHARVPAAFSEAEHTTLEALAELIGLTVHNHYRAEEALLSAAQLAHAFAALRDFETGDHLHRVSLLARLIAEELAASHGLSPEAIDQIGRFSRLHDIGKIGIPDAILLKQGPLSEAERRVMDTHVELGLAMIDQVLDQNDLDHRPGAEVLRNVIRHHHERLDGSGYPQGLRGEAISLEGRIVAVADVFDALTSRRPYREGCTVAEGLALVQEQAAAGQLDRACVAALAAHSAVLEQLLASYGDQPLIERTRH